MHCEYDYLKQSFLTYYSLLSSICADHVDCEVRFSLFEELRELFCLPQEKLQCFYDLLSSSAYRQLEDTAAYERLRRTLAYAEMIGVDTGLTSEDTQLLPQLAQALRKKDQILSHATHMTWEGVLTALQYSAVNGYVDAMLLTAFMEYHGIGVSQDQDRAVRRMALGAKWNSLFGILLCLKYDRAKADEYLGMLTVTLRSVGQREIYTYICRTLDLPCDPVRNEGANLMEKAFAIGVVTRERYDRRFAKIAFSPVIDWQDKQKLLLNGNWQGQTDGIPFGMKQMPIALASVPDTFLMARGGEWEKVMQNIAVAVKCPGLVQKPLLLYGEDECVADAYETALKKLLADAPVVEVDAATLTMHDFEATGEHMLLRALHQTKRADSFLFIKNCDMLDVRLAEELRRVLDPTVRKQFHLSHPSLSLDLGGVRFVLFAAGHTPPVRKLGAVCDTVAFRAASEAEKETVVKETFSVCRDRFGLSVLRLENDLCISYLAGMKSRRMVQVLDEALRAAVYRGSATLTLEQLEKAACEQANTSFEHGFGYTGFETK